MATRVKYLWYLFIEATLNSVSISNRNACEQQYNFEFSLMGVTVNKLLLYSNKMGHCVWLMTYIRAYIQKSSLLYIKQSSEQTGIRNEGLYPVKTFSSVCKTFRLFETLPQH